MYKIYKYETCPQCQGHGKNSVGKFHDYSGTPCGRCKGSGAIRVIWGEIEECAEKDSTIS